MNLSIKKLTNQLLAGLNPRQRDILESRYGLVNFETQTLQAIGDRYGITREGIRRIEEQALESVSKNSGKGEFVNFVKTVKDVIRKMGGVRKESELVKDIRYVINDRLNPELFVNHLKFLLEVSNAVNYYPETKEFHNHWYLSEDDRKKSIAFVNALAKGLKKGEAADSYFKQLYAVNFAAISKKFSVNVYGEFGLADSPLVVPKSAPDLAYLILRKGGKPMHFFELAGLVNKHQKEKFHPQAVHNELIKDDKFVLVGKGTYALREQGYIPGIAREVIARLIKENGPLHSHQVVKLVSQERFFKENTVLINLQNKSYFKRLSDGRYSVSA